MDLQGHKCIPCFTLHQQKLWTKLDDIQSQVLPVVAMKLHMVIPWISQMWWLGGKMWDMCCSAWTGAEVQFRLLVQFPCILKGFICTLPCLLDRPEQGHVSVHTWKIWSHFEKKRVCHCLLVIMDERTSIFFKKETHYSLQICALLKMNCDSWSETEDLLKN